MEIRQQLRGLRCTLAAGLSILALVTAMIAPQAHAQAGADPFIPAIEAMKRSISPVMCIRPHAETARFSPIFVGTGFFVSTHGDFVTAAHVVNAFAAGQPEFGNCPMFLWYASLDRNFVGKLDVHFFPVATAACAVEPRTDLALCHTADDLGAIKGVTSPVPVRFDFAQQPDGTAIAITGFPLLSPLPVTSRGYIAAYAVDVTGPAQMILDRAAWPGGSGSPIYDSRGRVLGVLVIAGEGAASGISYARSGFAIKEFLAAHPLPVHK